MIFLIWALPAYLIAAGFLGGLVGVFTGAPEGLLATAIVAKFSTARYYRYPGDGVLSDRYEIEKPTISLLRDLRKQFGVLPEIPDRLLFTKQEMLAFQGVMAPLETLRQMAIAGWEDLSTDERASRDKNFRGMIKALRLLEPVAVVLKPIIERPW